MTTCVRMRTKVEDTIRECLDRNEKALITFVTGGFPSADYTVFKGYDHEGQYS